MLTGAQHLQNIHPLVIHFPIGLLMGATLFYFAAWVFRKEDWAKTGFWVLLLGALSLVVAVGTGLYAEQGVMVALDVRQNLLLAHKQLMIATSVICFIVTVWAIVVRPFPKKGRIIFIILLLVMVALDVRQNILLAHKQFMIATSVICFIVTVWAITARPFPKKGRIIFLVLLLAMIGAMTVGADFGGRLVYDYNAGGNACPQPIHFKA